MQDRVSFSSCPRLASAWLAWQAPNVLPSPKPCKPDCAGLATSTGAYLLGVMPPELLTILGLSLPLMRRDPHYFLPTTEAGKYLLFGSDEDAMRAQFLEKFSPQDWSAYQALQVRHIATAGDNCADCAMSYTFFACIRLRLAPSVTTSRQR